MKKKITFLLFVLMMVTLVSGCGKSDGNGQKDQFADRVMVAAMAVAPSSGFNPYADVGAVEGMVNVDLYSTLIQKDSNGKMSPYTAEKYEMSADGMTYTFYLRKGVKFSNGAELKASDVKFSIETAMKSPYTYDGYISVGSVEAVDDYTVKVNMKAPDAAFLEKLSSVFYSYIVNEEAYKQYGDQYGKTAEATIGSGPYVLAEYKPGESCTLEANPDYFMGSPDIKTVSIKAISDSNAAIIALQTGDIDIYLDDVPAIAIDSISKDSNLSLKEYQSTVFYFLSMNYETGPFKDVRLRQAVAYAIDRAKVNTFATEGMGTVVDNPGGPSFVGNPGGKTWYKMDIEKAKQLVKEAGMEGKTIVLKTIGTNPLPKVATAVQDSLNQIGLKIEVQQLEQTAFIDDVRNGSFELAAARYWGLTMDMDEIMFSRYHSSMIGVYNASRYSNPMMDDVILKAKSEMNPEKRVQLYKEAIKIYTDDAVEIPLFYSPAYRAYTKDLIVSDDQPSYHTGVCFFDYKWND